MIIGPSVPVPVSGLPWDLPVPVPVPLPLPLPLPWPLFCSLRSLGRRRASEYGSERERKEVSTHTATSEQTNE